MLLNIITDDRAPVAPLSPRYRSEAVRLAEELVFGGTVLGRGQGGGPAPPGGASPYTGRIKSFG